MLEIEDQIRELDSSTYQEHFAYIWSVLHHILTLYVNYVFASTILNTNLHS